MDHSTPTLPKALWVIDDQAKAQLAQLERNCAEFGVELFALGDSRNGIVHVIGPERGFTQPGKTIVCGDSHTSTHGAFGALAFGIGTSEVEHVLATQCLLQRKPKTLEVRVEGQLMPGVTAKDIILALCAEIGTGGGTGYVIEFTGSAIRALDMEGRMTVCNMSIEAGARAGMIAPDETTFEYLRGASACRRGRLGRRGRTLEPARHGRGREFDKTVVIDANKLEPHDHLRHQPGHGHADQRADADPDSFEDSSQRAASRRRCATWASSPGSRCSARKSTWSSSARARTRASSDLRMAAGVFSGRKVADGVRDAGRPRLARHQEAGRVRRARPDLQRGGRRMARAGLLDVHRHERRQPRAGAVRGQHLEP